MKKLLFSAAALVAFSFAGMANEIKETETTKSNEEVVVVEDECVTFSFLVADLFEATTGITLSPLAAGNLIMDAYDICDKNR